MSETFNLDRKMNIDNNIDPLGKKWEIFHLKGSALYEARPNPYNAATEIPSEFQGRWTKPDLLQSQINLYLNRAWDKAEDAAKKAPGKERAKAAKKKTTKESLNELPDEIKKELGDTIATEE